jgi:Copper amine oxidase N-terminal domain
VIGAPVVAVVFDGQQLLSSRPALLQAGSVVVPLDPFMTRLTTRVEIDADGRTMTFVRSEDSVTVALGNATASVGSRLVRLPIAPYLRDGGPIIPLAAIARGLGLRVWFDARSRVVSIVSGRPPPLATMTPFAPVPGAEPYATPRVDPTAAPRPTVTGIPRPRRTPIELHGGASNPETP